MKKSVRLVIVYFLCVVGFVGNLWADEVLLDEAMHHIRNGASREWSSFPVEAEAKEYVLGFDLERPDAMRLLTLLLEGTRQVWSLKLNGQALTKLPRDHNHFEWGLAIPEGLLKELDNVLEVTTEAEDSDDIRIGAVVLHDEVDLLVDEERAEALFAQRGYRRAVPVMQQEVSMGAIEAESGQAVPCRFTIIDEDTGALVFIGAESNQRIAVREGVVYSIDGTATIRLAGNAAHPRRYTVYCGRGFEYSLESTSIVIDGSEDDVKLSFSLKREVETPGLVACDTHLHTFEFDRHGDCSVEERIISAVGEGVELPISTGHDKHIDYAELAEQLGASNWCTPVVGCEVTTHLGHFNTFPVEVGATPAEHKLRTWDQIFQNIFATPGVQVCILNHARDVHRNYTPFAPEHFDRETGALSGGRKLSANAMELINSGAQKTDPMQLVHDWFALLKSGKRIAGVGSSDSHTVNYAIAGQARTYLECPDEDVSQLDLSAAVDSMLSGRSWVSLGLLTRLDFDPGGESVTVKVLGPGWTSANFVQVFLNGEEVKRFDLTESQGQKPGEKLSESLSLSDLGAKPGDFLCAVAMGPGIAGGEWMIQPPYQPDSPEFEPFVMGISPAVWVE